MKFIFSKLSIVVIVCLFFPNKILSQYWQQQVNYQIDINFDVKKHQFDGTESLKYYNNSPDTLHQVFFHLYFNAFQPNSMMDVHSRSLPDPDKRVADRISKLTEKEIGYHHILELQQDDTPLDFHIEGTVLEVTLTDPIPPGDSSTFFMEFESQVPVQIRRSGRYNSEGIAYSMSQWYPKMAEYDEMGWHAHPYVAREFYAPWGNFDVNITIDPKFILAGTGIITSSDANDSESRGKKKTWRFHAENVHDFVWAADPDYHHMTAQVPHGPKLHFYYQKDSNTIHWEKLPEYTIRAFEFIQEHFGEYPYPQYSVIQGGDGGMEYPMATLITGHRDFNSLLGVVIHEALHSWYQGMLATNESYYAWMDEGFTEYVEAKTMQHLFPERYENQKHTLVYVYDAYKKLVLSGYEEPMSMHADHFSTNFAYGMAAYTKGAITLQQLGYIIGEENLARGMKKYYQAWRFKHPDMNDFIRVMEKQSSLELHWYFEYWISTTHTIDYAIDTVFADREKTIIQLQKIGKMPMPIETVITKKDGEKLLYYAPLGIMRGEKPSETPFRRIVGQDWSWTHSFYSFQLEVPLEEIQTIEIDPSGRMADINRENNIFEAE